MGKKKLDRNKKIKEHPEDIKYFIRFNYKEQNNLTVKYVLGRLQLAGLNIGMG